MWRAGDHFQRRRLYGGGRRLVRTFLRANSLLTGKNTGNFANLADLFRPSDAISASLWSTSGPERRFESQTEQGIIREANRELTGQDQGITGKNLIRWIGSRFRVEPSVLSFANAMPSNTGSSGTRTPWDICSHEDKENRSRPAFRHERPPVDCKSGLNYGEVQLHHGLPG